MRQRASITTANLTPAVPGATSIVHISVDIPAIDWKDWPLDNIYGSLPDLISRFGIQQPAPDTWDLSILRGRICIVEETATGYQFISFA